MDGPVIEKVEPVIDVIILNMPVVLEKIEKEEILVPVETYICTCGAPVRKDNRKHRSSTRHINKIIALKKH